MPEIPFSFVVKTWSVSNKDGNVISCLIVHSVAMVSGEVCEGSGS